MLQKLQQMLVAQQQQQQQRQLHELLLQLLAVHKLAGTGGSVSPSLTAATQQQSPLHIKQCGMSSDAYVLHLQSFVRYSTSCHSETAACHCMCHVMLTQY